MGGACLVGRGSGWGLCVGREGQWAGHVASGERLTYV